jgi:hypothetical protein
MWLLIILITLKVLPVVHQQREDPLVRIMGEVSSVDLEPMAEVPELVVVLKTEGSQNRQIHLHVQDSRM